MTKTHTLFTSVGDRPRRRLAGRLLGAGALMLATLGTSLAQAQTPPQPQPQSQMPSPSPRGDGHGHGGPPSIGGAAPMMWLGGPPAMIGRSVDRLLDGLNATDAQRAQIRQIAIAAAADLRSQREAGRGLHDRGLQIFSAPSVDANAAEALRQQMSEQHDQASRRVLRAMLDIANVLTPEQRATVGQRLRDRDAAMRDRMDRMRRDRPDRPAPPASSAK